MIRFLSILAVLLLALAAQFALASAGFHLNLALAVLIALAFISDFWEFAFFVLLSVFLLNWKPAASGTMILFALVPFAAFTFQKLVRSQAWIGNLIAIFAGFLIFYVVPAPTMFLANMMPFLMNVIVGLLVGEVVLFALN